MLRSVIPQLYIGQRCGDRSSTRALAPRGASLRRAHSVLSMRREHALYAGFNGSRSLSGDAGTRQASRPSQAGIRIRGPPPMTRQQTNTPELITLVTSDIPLQHPESTTVRLLSVVVAAAAVLGSVMWQAYRAVEERMEAQQRAATEANSAAVQNMAMTGLPPTCQAAERAQAALQQQVNQLSSQLKTCNQELARVPLLLKQVQQQAADAAAEAEMADDIAEAARANLDCIKGKAEKAQQAAEHAQVALQLQHNQISGQLRKSNKELERVQLVTEKAQQQAADTDLGAQVAYTDKLHAEKARQAAMQAQTALQQQLDQLRSQLRERDTELGKVQLLMKQAQQQAGDAAADTAAARAELATARAETEKVRQAALVTGQQLKEARRELNNLRISHLQLMGRVGAMLLADHGVAALAPPSGQQRAQGSKEMKSGSLQ